MDKNIFIRADELAVELDVSKALAYKMINQQNEELKAKGYAHVAQSDACTAWFQGRYTQRYRV